MTARGMLAGVIAAALLLAGCTASAPTPPTNPTQPTTPTVAAERTTVPNPDLDAALIKAAWANDLATATDRSDAAPMSTPRTTRNRARFSSRRPRVSPSCCGSFSPTAATCAASTPTTAPR